MIDSLPALKANVFDNENNKLVSFSKNSLTRHTTEEQHKKSCRVCKHSQIDEINEKIINLDLDEAFFEQYSLDFSILWKHIKACNLLPSIQETQKIQQLRTIIKVNTKGSKTSDALALLDQLSKQAGVYQETAQPVDIQILQQLVGAMIPTTPIPKPIDTNNIDTPALDILSISQVDTDTTGNAK